MDILVYIDELIKEYNNTIEKLKEEKKQEYTFDNFLALSFEKKEELLKTYHISSIAYKLDIISNYYRIKDELFLPYFEKSLNKLVPILVGIIDEVNDKIKEENQIVNNKIKEIECKCTELLTLKDILNDTKQYSSYNKICDILLNSKLNDEIIATLISSISTYFLKFKDITDVDLFEEQINKPSKINDNNNEIQNKTIAIINMFQDKNSKYYLSNFSYDGLNVEELEEVLIIINEEGYDLTTFKWLVGIYINEILNNKNQETVIKYYNSLSKLTEMYKISVDNKEELRDKCYKLSSLLENINLNNSYINNIRIFIENIKNNLSFIISHEFYQNANEKLSEYLKDINKFIKDDTVRRKDITKLDKFVLFANSPEGIPYFMKDLFDPKDNMIDNRSFSNTEYLKEFSNLILDLFEYGKPACAQFIDSKFSSDIDRVIMHIYYPTKKGNVDRDNPTDMWRIRPNLSSNARFVEIKTVIPNNTIIFKQVKQIINKHLPHITLDDNQNFTFIINIGAAVKKADVELYKEAIKRYDKIGIDILKLFYVNGKYHKSEGILKTKLNNEEYQQLEKYIVNSIKLLKELESKNIDFQFSPLLGGNNYGLSK